MNIEEAKEIMGAVKAFEEWDANRSPYEKAEAAKELSSAVRAYVEGEAELGGWYIELMQAIGEEEPEPGETTDLAPDSDRVSLAHEAKSARDALERLADCAPTDVSPVRNQNR